MAADPSATSARHSSNPFPAATRSLQAFMRIFFLSCADTNQLVSSVGTLFSLPVLPAPPSSLRNAPSPGDVPCPALNWLPLGL